MCIERVELQLMCEQRDVAERSSWSLTYLKDVADEIKSEQPSESPFPLCLQYA